MSSLSYAKSSGSTRERGYVLNDRPQSYTGTTGSVIYEDGLYIKERSVDQGHYFAVARSNGNDGEESGSLTRGGITETRPENRFFDVSGSAKQVMYTNKQEREGGPSHQSSNTESHIKLKKSDGHYLSKDGTPYAKHRQASAMPRNVKQSEYLALREEKRAYKDSASEANSYSEVMELPRIISSECDSAGLRGKGGAYLTRKEENKRISEEPTAGEVGYSHILDNPASFYAAPDSEISKGDNGYLRLKSGEKRPLDEASRKMRRISYDSPNLVERTSKPGISVAKQTKPEYPYAKADARASADRYYRKEISSRYGMAQSGKSPLAVLKDHEHFSIRKLNQETDRYIAKSAEERYGMTYEGKLPIAQNEQRQGHFDIKKGAKNLFVAHGDGGGAGTDTLADVKPHKMPIDMQIPKQVQNVVSEVYISQPEMQERLKPEEMVSTHRYSADDSLSGYQRESKKVERQKARSDVISTYTGQLQRPPQDFDAENVSSDRKTDPELSMQDIIRQRRIKASIEWTELKSDKHTDYIIKFLMESGDAQEIQCHCKEPIANREFFVSKRYSEFSSFYLALSKLLERIRIAEPLPALPPKTYLWQLSESTITLRKTAFQRLLTMVLANREISEDSECADLIAKFICPH